MPELSPEIIALQKRILEITEQIEGLHKKSDTSKSDATIAELKTRIEELIVSRDELRNELAALKKPTAVDPVLAAKREDYELGHFS